MNPLAPTRSPQDTAGALESLLPGSVEFLNDLLRIPSLSGEEGSAIDFIETQFSPFADEIIRLPFPPDFTADEEFSTTLPKVTYENRHVLEIRLNAASANAPTIILNTHTDVVPPTPGQLTPFEPRLAKQTLFARGACDAKGQIATMHLLAAQYRHLGEAPPAHLVLHIVVEEEPGGNGTLNAIRHFNRHADAAIVMEPTDLRVLSAVRGAVWFRLLCRGTAGHSGDPNRTVNAIRLAIEALGLFDEYHRQLLAESKSIPLFSEFANPMPLNFGHFSAGNWPATAPELAQVEGVLGFLTNRTRAQVIHELRSVLINRGSANLRERATLEFMYRHEAHALDSDHPLVAGFATALAGHALNAAPAAFPASCDGWFYANLLGIPTVLFGPGKLAHAHSIDEQIETGDILSGAGVLRDAIACFAARHQG